MILVLKNYIYIYRERERERQREREREREGEFSKISQNNSSLETTKKKYITERPKEIYVIFLQIGERLFSL